MTLDVGALPECFVDASVSAAVIADERGKPSAPRLIRNALRLTSAAEVTSSLVETLSALKAGDTLSTSVIFEAGWLSRRTVQRHLAKLESLGLVRRSRVKGVRGDCWCITSRGILTIAREERGAL